MAEALRLRPPRNQVDRRAIGWWAVTAVIEVAVPLVISLVLAMFIEPARSWLLLLAALLTVLGLGYVLVMPAWRFRVHRWEATEEAVYTRSGWLFQEWRIAPLSRIQTVDTARGPLEQLFKLSSVTVTTASAAGPLHIHGLDHQLAADLAHRLTETTQATPGDAT